MRTLLYATRSVDRSAYAEPLALAGHEVVTARNRSEALELLATSFDIVVVVEGADPTAASVVVRRASLGNDAPHAILWCGGEPPLTVAGFSLSLDKTSGKNGDVLMLTVNVLAVDPTKVEGYILETELNGVKRRMPGFVY
jgi:hypothetical protein